MPFLAKTQIIFLVEEEANKSLAVCFHSPLVSDWSAKLSKLLDRIKLTSCGAYL